jgi:hypothetical protein
MPSPDEYAHAVTRQAIARAGAALGFKTAQADVLDCLADVLAQYIEKLSRESLNNAELHGRAQPGIQDLFQALEGLRPLKSGWQDLRDFAFPELLSIPGSSAPAASAEGVVGDDEEDGESGLRSASGRPAATAVAWHQPFPFVVPSFPVQQVLRRDDASASIGEKIVRGAHVPDHLPPYPPQHTYKRSAASSSAGRKRAAALSAQEKERQRIKREATSSISKSLSKIEDCADEVGEA